MHIETIGFLTKYVGVTFVGKLFEMADKKGFTMHIFYLSCSKIKTNFVTFLL